MTPGRMTGIERMMAHALDDLGCEYEREVRFGIYRVDFLLRKHRLVIECDGLWWHSKPLRKAKDDRKDSYLNACGLIVFRAAEFAIRQDAVAIARAALRGAGVVIIRA